MTQYIPNTKKIYNNYINQKINNKKNTPKIPKCQENP